MYLRILGASLARRWRRKLLAVASVALGVMLMTALVTIALDVGDKVGREVGAYGANIDVEPAAGLLAGSLAGGAAAREPSLLLDERDLPRLTSFFWAHNVLAFAPLLSTPARTADGRSAVLVGTWFEHALRQDGGATTTGVRELAPWWRVDGRWPSDRDGAEAACLAGRRAAQALGLERGGALDLRGPHGGARVLVVGILTTGGAEEDWIWAPLPIAQALAGAPGRYARLSVSALTTPESDLSGRDARTLTRQQLERLECTAYPSTIARSIARTLPGARARPVRTVTETQGAVLARVRLVLLALLVAGALAAALGVLGAMAAAVLERRAEVGLLKALGAPSSGILALFLGEAVALGLAGGALGYVAGSGLAIVIGRAVFGSPVVVSAVVLPLALAAACGLSVAGSALPVRRALRVDAARVLHGE